GRNGNTIDITCTEWHVPPNNPPPNDTYYDQSAFPQTIRYGGNPSLGVAHTRRIEFVSLGPRSDYVLNAALYTQFLFVSKVDRIDEYVGPAGAETLVR